MKTKVKVGEVLKLIPDAILDKIGNDMEVDKINQFLTGKTIFKAVLFSLSQTTRISLRYIENVYNSAIFQQHLDADAKKIKGRHSSFADRLKKINVTYFADIFKHLVETYHNKLSPKEAHNIYRFDATIISISSKLFNGIVCGGSGKEQHFKVVIGQKGLIPSAVYFCSERSEANDDMALKRAIIEASISNNDIVTFDRGIQATKTFLGFSDSNKMFVSRIRTSRRYKLVENYEVPEATLDDNNRIISDQKIFIYGKKRPFETPFRLIKVQAKDQEIWLFTNIFHLSNNEIIQIYKRRWDIEVLFRFMKQELNCSHFLAHNRNGLMVHIYMILIFSILLLLYKSMNSLTGFKFVKISFFQELENEIICDLIKMSGGDPTIFLRKFNLL